MWYTWFDRDLGVAGRVVVKRAGVDEKARHALVKIDRPVMRIPSLAIHLNREMNNGFAVNFQQHMVPIIANAAEAARSVSDPSTPPNPRGPRRPTKEPPRRTPRSPPPGALELVAEAAGCDPADVCDFDLQLCDVQPSTIGGAKNEYIFSGRLDNSYRVTRRPLVPP